MAAGMLFVGAETGFTVSQVPQADQAVAPNFERFDGLELPLDHPAAVEDGSGRSASGYGATPRPGQHDQPLGQVYTAGPLRGLVGVLGGQPLPVRAWESADDSAATRGYTPSRTPSVQFRMGVGQDNQGVAQTVALSEITANPPIPGDLTSILAGLG
jgi:hypothetical protein